MNNSSRPNVLYHYTSLDTFFTIINNIRNDKLTLRATSYTYLNDFTENQVLLKIFRELVKENEVRDAKKYYRDLSSKSEVFWNKSFIKAAAENLFVTSFSECKDELPMWHMYADSSTGIAIGFDYRSLPELIQREPLVGPPCLGVCKYSELEIKKNLNKFFDIYYFQTGKFFDQKLSMIHFRESILFKHPKFYYEKEWRVIKKLYSDDPTVKYFCKNNILKPYIEWQLDKFSIKEVIVGPCSDSKMNINSIKSVLEMHLFKVIENEKESISPNCEIVLKASVCPYRNI